MNTYTWVTDGINTGGMFACAGSWLSDGNAGTIVGPSTITDNSIAGNPAAVVGTCTKVDFNPPCDDIQGGCLATAVDEIRMTGDSTAILSGYQSTDGGATWLYRTGSQFFNLVYDSGDWVVTGDANLTMCYAMLTLNG